MDSLIDCVTMPIRDNLNDKYDKMYLKILKIIMNILAFNLFSLKISAYKVLFENISKIYSTARYPNSKLFAKDVMIKLFTMLTHRLKLQGIFFKSSNPTSFFYSSQAKALIEAESKASLDSLVDSVVLKVEYNDLMRDSAVVLGLEKDQLMALPHIDFTNKKLNIPLTTDENGEINKSQDNGETANTSLSPADETEKPGTFGWCYVCRKSAYYYCKERRVPICSFECKIKYSESIEKLQKQIFLSKQNEKEELSINNAYLELFAMLSEKCFDKKYEKERGCYLSILLNVIQSPSPSLRKDARFISFLKQEVFPNILKISIHSEDQILKISLIIFLNLVLNFRKYLRIEIGVFIQDVFMEILESANSKFIVKFYILQVLTTLIEEKSIPFELFLNFDCREGSSNICERTIDLLVKIAQGKYSKNIYAGLINLNEEEELRKEASQAIINLIKGTAAFLEQNHSQVEEIPKGITDVLHKKKLIDDAITKFNSGKKGGLKLLQDLKVIRDESPDALAEFLKNDKRVSHFMIGEIFGQEEEFYLKVLESYLNSINYAGTEILPALKHFLSLFELPGEGQKVERILEAFSKKLSDDNPELYTADGAYLFSFLLMMLHTNTHNPQVVEKMTLAQFLSIGKNVNNHDKPVPVDVLTKIYYEIQQVPLAIHSLEKRKRDIQDVLSRSYKEKQELFKLESLKIFETYTSKLKETELVGDYQFIENSSCLQIFLSTTWTSLMAFFSTTIANCDDMEVLRSLVDSTMSMILLCDNFNMQTERDSFVNLLVQFSGLEKTFNKLLDEKNLLFMQSVLSIAMKMGNHLHSGWKLVLNCIISLNYYQSQADKIRSISTPNSNFSIEEQNSLFVANHFSNDDLNKVFIDSKKLDEHSILDFIGGLASLSIKELEKGGSRVYYVLEQIVVVAHFNIYRNPLEWLRIWELIDKLYDEIISKNSITRNEITEFSVDILRQLVLCCFEVYL
jgi:brefeldin A-inhibited guanine nucleotide-exchange protein